MGWSAVGRNGNNSESGRFAQERVPGRTLRTASQLMGRAAARNAQLVTRDDDRAEGKVQCRMDLSILQTGRAITNGSA